MDNTIVVKCSNCGADFGLDEKSIDDNRSIYGPPIFCIYCSRRLE